MQSINLGLPGLAPASELPAERPDTPRLVDRFGRVATDLRVSLTDRCNLRCTYCMPAEGLEWLAPAGLLSDDELLRLVRLAVERLGILEVRYTGGEPLLRKSLEYLIEQTVALVNERGEHPEVSLTTNGLGLAKRGGALARAGLARVNVSLDTLDRARYASLTRRDRLSSVLAGIERCAAEGIGPIKINTVLMRGINESDAVSLACYSLENGYQLRFIEQMPLGPRERWQRQQMITTEQIVELLSQRFDLTPHPSAERGASPAGLWVARDKHGELPQGDIGIIGSVTEPFCAACDRTRLTADGKIRNCLFSTSETDLLRLMREGASDERLVTAWQGAMWAKKQGHGIDDPAFAQPDRPMSAIGG